MENAINFNTSSFLPLAKEIRKIKIGLGWDMMTPSEDLQQRFLQGDKVDLDLSCLVIDSNKKIVDTVFYRELASKDGCIKHSGDNESGAGDGDDEFITVDLYNLPSYVSTLIFTVTAYSGQSFEFIDNAFCRIVNAGNDEELANYALSTDGIHTAVIVLKVFRDRNGWTAQHIGEIAYAHSTDELLPQIVNYL